MGQLSDNSDTRLTLALMAGLPGAGKTTLSIELGRELGWHVINKDRHKEVLMGMGLDELTAGNAAYELSFDTIREVLISRRASVILDSPALRMFILDNVREIVRCVENVQLKIILCVADRDLRNFRLKNRPAQITNIHVDPETVGEYLRLFQHLPLEPERLTLQTNHSAEQCLQKAKDYLLDVSDNRHSAES